MTKFWKIHYYDGRVDVIDAKSYTITDRLVTFWKRSFEMMGFQSVTGKVGTYQIATIEKIVEAK